MKQERFFTSLVIVFSLLGTATLLYLSERASAPEAKLNDLSTMEGKQVTVEGTVVGVGEESLYLYGDSTVAEVYLNDAIDVDVLSKVRLRAQVISGGSIPKLEMISSRSLVKRGVFSPPEISLPLTGREEGAAMVEGVARSIVEEGYAVSGSLLPTSSWNETFFPGLPFRWYGSTSPLQEGSIIRGVGVISGGVLHLYGEGCVEVLGRLPGKELTMGELVRRASSGDSEVFLRPLSLRGFVLYEPRGSSIYLTESLPEGSISLRCNLLTSLKLHKGDLIVIRNATLTLDADTMRYALQSQEVVLITPHGPWNLTVEALIYSPLSFLGARVITEGVASQQGDYTFLEGAGGGKICVLGGGLEEGSTYRVEGTVVYVEERSMYAISLEG